MRERLKAYPFMRQLYNLQNGWLDPVYWPMAQKEFADRISKINNVDDAIEQLWQYQGAGFYRRLQPAQNRYEITTLAKRVLAIRPECVVEIGTAYGGTLFLWGQTLPELRHLVSIDLPGGIHGGGYPAERAKLYKLFTMNNPQCRIDLMRVDSHRQETYEELAELLAGRPIDFLFIDGDHRYEGAKMDYELYSPLVRSGGLIGFHDIRPNATDPTIEVFQLWNEIVAKEAHTEEIVQEPYVGHFGIGVVTKA